jgi:MFS family permease
MEANDRKKQRAVRLAVIVAALGYFVDIYDLVLFAVVRIASLVEMGVAKADLLPEGVFLINMQMSGMLLGGVLWGVLGDRRGRLSVLFGSILLYSLANIANGFVTSLDAYAVARFVAGVGLAGELGAGITLVSELMGKESRGYGTTIVATIGILGAVVAATVGDRFHWRTAYFVGGGLGLALLLLRIGVYESGMFEQMKKEDVRRGDFLALFSTWPRARRYLSVIAIGVPIWFVVGVLVTFSPEIAQAMGLATPPSTASAIKYCYIGLAVGDLTSGAISQWLRSRKKVVLGFVLLSAAMMAAYFLFGAASLTVFYGVCLGLGVATGYWAVFVTIAAEQFGTNLRATATTTAPNFVRGAVVPLTLVFTALKEGLGVVTSAGVVGAATIALALVALRGLDETHGIDLDYLER